MSILLLTMGPDLSITMDTPALRVGEPGSITLRANGAVGQVKWVLMSSSLPAEWDGIVANGNEATISTAEALEWGTYTFTVRAYDASRIPVVRTFEVRIATAEIVVAPGGTHDWIVGTPVSLPLAITGGTGVYVAGAVASGSLPSGVSASIVGSNLQISGTPSSIANDTAIISVTDSQGAQGVTSLDWEVENPPRIVYAGSFTTAFGVSRDRIARLMDDGTMDIALPGLGNSTRAIAVDNQGRLIAARNSVRRILFGGTLDPTWTVLSTSGTVQGVLPLADGRYVIFGVITAVNSVARSRIAILLSNGALDTSFVPPNLDSTVLAVAQDAGGGFIIGGAFQTISSTTQHCIARLTSTGTWDAGFASPFAVAGGQVKDIAIQSDGKIIVAGTNGGPNVRLRRLNSDGTLDTSWTYNAGARSCNCLALDESAGYVYCGSGNSLFLRRHLLTDGSIDTGFTPTLSGTVEDVAIQPDGKVIAVGSISMDGLGGTGLRRYTTSGTNDGTFTGAGVANGDILAVALQGAP